MALVSWLFWNRPCFLKCCRTSSASLPAEQSSKLLTQSMEQLQQHTKQSSKPLTLSTEQLQQHTEQSSKPLTHTHTHANPTTAVTKNRTVASICYILVLLLLTNYMFVYGRYQRNRFVFFGGHGVDRVGSISQKSRVLSKAYICVHSSHSKAHTCMNVHMHAHLHTHTNTQTHTHTYAHACSHLRVRTHTHTHTHTHCHSNTLQMRTCYCYFVSDDLLSLLATESLLVARGRLQGLTIIFTSVTRSCSLIMKSDSCIKRPGILRQNPSFCFCFFHLCFLTQ